MSLVCYHIVDWNANFENNRTRELKRLGWVPIPNKHDSAGYNELMDHPNGPSHYAAWVVMVQVASKCDPRGTLMRRGENGTGRPHDSGSLSRMTRVPASVFEEAIPRLIEVGWLGTHVVASQTHGEIPQDDAVISQEGAALGPQEGATLGSQEGALEGNGTEQNRTEGDMDAPRGYSERFETFWALCRKHAPHKAKAKAEAARNYDRAVKQLKASTEDPHAFLCDRAAAYYRSPEGQTRFASGPAPWLNQGRWDDDPAAWQESGEDDRGPHEPVEAPMKEY